MTPEQIAGTAKRYAERFRAFGLIPERCNPDAIPNAEVCLSHVLWVTETGIPDLLAQGKHAKAMRWICFCQGVIWALRLGTISSFKDDNR